MKTIDKGKLGIIAGVLAVILFFAVNIVSGITLKSARLDLTENGLYTLSDGTKEVLASIEEPIIYRFYASRSLAEAAPAYGEFMNRVRELLEQYASLSGGKIQLEVINPEPYSVEEDQAVGYGLQGVQLDSGGEQVYFGLVATNSTDDQQVIPFFDMQRERYLEYDLTRQVFNLANPEKKVVGLMAYLPIDADPAKQYKPWAVTEQMEEFFQVKPVGLQVKRIPDDIDLLMIVHPKAVSEDTQYAIEQFILRGGRAMIFVDPHSEVDSELAAAMRQPAGNTGSDLHKLFDAWGIEYTPEKFVGDREAAARVEVPGSGGRRVVTDYVSWIGLGPQNFNSDDVTTADLNRIFMAGAGYLSKKDGADIEVTPLITTGEHAMRIDTAKVRMQPDPVQLLRDFKSEAHPFTIAARIHGTLKTAFPDGPPEKAEDKDGKDDAELLKKLENEHLYDSASPANLIVVADVDMLADRSWLQFQNFFGRQVAVPTANNAAFVVNSLDNLLGSNALIGLRSRGLSLRPFTRVEALKNAAEREYSETEQNLQQKMKDTQAKIGKLDTTDSEGQAILTDDQKQTLQKFRAELIDIRQQLREVQHNLRKDIDALDTWLKILNIWAVPAVVCVVAIVMAWIRRRRYRQRSFNA